MLIRTLLNKVQKFKGFKFESVSLGEYRGEEALKIKIVPRKGSKPICSVGGKPTAGYDNMGFREFEFIPIWGF